MNAALGGLGITLFLTEGVHFNGGGYSVAAEMECISIFGAKSVAAFQKWHREKIIIQSTVMPSIARA